MVVLDEVSIVYGDRTILAPTRIQFQPGVVHVLRGRSGSGKTSLLRCIAGLQRPTGGRIRGSKGEAIRGVLIEQDPHLVPELGLLENIVLPARLEGRPGSWKQEANRWMATLGLQLPPNHAVSRLSGGERQRAAIARAMLLGPDVLLLDEPTSALDRENAESVVRSLQELARMGRTILVASHDEVFDGQGPTWRLRDGRMIREA